MSAPINDLNDYCVENEIERLRLRAYNLIPGSVFLEFIPDSATFSGEPFPSIDTWVVKEATQYVDTEQVFVLARTLGHDGNERVRHKRFLLNFMQDVSVVGLVVHPNDDSDNDDGM